MIDITETERAALHAFALQYGYQWKSYLKAAWLSYKHNGKHMGGEDTGTLRAIRNQRGMRWLEKIRTADLEPPAAPATPAPVAPQLQDMATHRLIKILAVLTETPNGDPGCVALAARVRAELVQRAALPLVGRVQRKDYLPRAGD